MLVLNDPTLTITFSGPAEVDLAPYLVAAEVDAASDTIDGRTFGKPRRSRMGGGMDTITLALLWSPAMYEALQPHEYEEGTLAFTPAVGGDTLGATVRYGRVPFGDFRIGERVEVDLVLGCLSALAWA